MLAQKLRHRVTVEALTVTQDPDTGAQVETWSTYAAGVPAEVVPMSGREFVAASATQAEVDTRICVRHDPGITASMRIVHEVEGVTTSYNIRAILPDPKLIVYRNLMCQSGPNDG